MGFWITGLVFSQLNITGSFSWGTLFLKQIKMHSEDEIKFCRNGDSIAISYQDYGSEGKRWVEQLTSKYSHERLDQVIYGGPFQPELFYDSVLLMFYFNCIGLNFTSKQYSSQFYLVTENSFPFLEKSLISIILFRQYRQTHV